MPDRDQSYSSNRGFASMDQQRQREIASKGGQASGGNFKNDPERASEAGRKGGQSVPAEERSFSRDPELASQAGRKGGETSHGVAGVARGGQPVGSRHETGERQAKPGGTVGRDIPERSKAHDTEIAVEAGRHPGEQGHAGGPSHPATERGQVKPGGTVGREIPEHSKAHDTEIAVEAGRHGGGPKDQNR